ELGVQFTQKGHEVCFYTHEWEDVTQPEPNFKRVPMAPWPRAIRPLTYAVAMRHRRDKNDGKGVLQLASGCGMIQDIVCAQSCHKAWVVQSRAALHPQQLRWWLKT